MRQTSTPRLLTFLLLCLPSLLLALPAPAAPLTPAANQTQAHNQTRHEVASPYAMHKIHPSQGDIAASLNPLAVAIVLVEDADVKNKTRRESGGKKPHRRDEVLSFLNITGVVATATAAGVPTAGTTAIPDEAGVGLEMTDEHAEEMLARLRMLAVAVGSVPDSREGAAVTAEAEDGGSWRGEVLESGIGDGIVGEHVGIAVADDEGLGGGYVSGYTVRPIAEVGGLDDAEDSSGMLLPTAWEDGAGGKTLQKRKKVSAKQVVCFTFFAFCSSRKGHGQ